MVYKIKKWQLPKYTEDDISDTFSHATDVTDIGPNDHHPKFTLEDHANIDHSNIPGIEPISGASILAPEINEFYFCYIGETITLQINNQSRTCFKSNGDSIVDYEWKLPNDQQVNGLSISYTVDSSIHNVGDELIFSCRAVSSFSLKSPYYKRKIKILDNNHCRISNIIVTPVNSATYNFGKFPYNDNYICPSGEDFYVEIIGEDPQNRNIDYTLVSDLDNIQIEKIENNKFKVSMPLSTVVRESVFNLTGFNGFGHTSLNLHFIFFDNKDIFHI